MNQRQPHQLEYAVVTGDGEFPFDMLRYDACYPVSDPETCCLGKSEPGGRRSIVVASWTCQAGTWSPKEWEGLGWSFEGPFNRRDEADNVAYRRRSEGDATTAGGLRVIDLGSLGIKVKLTGDGSGMISSELHEPRQNEWSVEEKEAWLRYDAAMHAVESMILGHACAGVDITDSRYVEGVETAVEACSNVP